MANEKIGQVKKIGGLIFNVFSWLIISFVSLAIVVSFFIQNKNQQISLFGYSLAVISSSSMQNDFNIGDKVIVKGAGLINTDDLRKDDIILFYQYADFCDLILSPHTEITDILETYEEPEYNDAEIFKERTNITKVQKMDVDLVFHRITKVFADEYGVRFFETKGDFNKDSDKILIREDYVYGKHIQNSLFVTRTLNFITSTTTMIMLLSLVIVLGTLQIIILFKKYIGERTARKLMKRKISFYNPILKEKKVYNYLTRAEKIYLYDIAKDKEKDLVVDLFWGDLRVPRSQKGQCKIIILLKKSFKLYKKDRNKFWDFWLSLESNKRKIKRLKKLQIRADLILLNDEK
ncbi:MAG: hypothetical protein PHI76_01620 [Clostridia bacterium]|nr:hypothetical protein [Clostridia bacterium]